MTVSCGIDFGTSNTSIALAKNGEVSLVAVEGNSVTIPSAIFFEAGTNKARYGREAVDLYLDHSPGRFMRSLKRVLGTSLMKQGTVVNYKHMKFENIIAAFLRQVKHKADAVAGQDIEHVVMGRPVHFVDNDPAADTRAEHELRAIAATIGFRHVGFQFEPIAAAFAHEVNVEGEKLAIVVDLGGGTSDFTIIRLSNQNLHKADRTADILANAGVRVGGNDFDKALSLAAFMPEFGYRSVYGPKKLEVPLKPFHDLAEWSKVNLLYTPKLIGQLREMLHQSHDRHRFSRILTILEKELGHTVLALAESTKIDLTTQSLHRAPFDAIEPNLYIDVTAAHFAEAIAHDVEQIAATARLCLQLAALTPDRIELVILTGGSTEVPAVQAVFRALFPQAAIADHDKLSSVGLGLAYDSRNRL